MLHRIITKETRTMTGTNKTKADVDTDAHRIETVPGGKISVSEALKSFFEVEIRNEDEGGVRPATLDSAKGSWMQAPEDVRASWCGLGEDPDESSRLFATVKNELDSLIDRYGPDVQLATLVD